MSRTEFLAELERLLSGLPEEERQAAVQYYADYFADAGEANEAGVIRELGSPEKVAESIKADYYGTEFDEAKFDRRNYMEKYGQRSEKAGEENGRNAEDTDSRAYAQDGVSNVNEEQKNAPWTSRGLKILLIALIVIVVWPVSLGLAGAVIGIVAAAVGFFACLVVAAASVMLAGGIVAVTGLALMMMPPAGMIVVGIGILLFVLGLIATVAAVKLCIIVYPAMLKGFVNLCRRPFYGKAVS